MINRTFIQPSDKNIADDQIQARELDDKVVASNDFTVSLYLKFQNFLLVQSYSALKYYVLISYKNSEGYEHSLIFMFYSYYSEPD